jgi:benzoyl-CoA reductase/2-hydroxyglutaryl-CoA dehydratase subunit BcrC/BadD/HgdB
MKNIINDIKDIKNKGRKVIGCFPLYPPLELFHSLGLVPITLWGLKDSIPTVGKSDRHLQPYACSVARHLTEFLLSENGAALDGLFMYNACDTLRNLPEIINCGLADAGRSLPVFKMHIPMMPREQTESSAYLRARIEALIQEVEKAYQVTFSMEKFRQSVSLYREIRNLYKALGTRVANGFMSYDEFSRITQEGWFTPAEDQLLVLQKILQDESLFARENVTSTIQGRIVVSGILPPPQHMIKAFENAGLTVVGNDIASQNRALFYTPAMVDDPADYYVDFYDHHYPCTTLLYTADKRVTAVQELVSSTKAQGVVFIGEKFCEFEYFEIPHLEKILKDMGIQTLFLEVSIDDVERSEAYVTRIEAFSELMGSDNQGGRYAK